MSYRVQPSLFPAYVPPKTLTAGGSIPGRQLLLALTGSTASVSSSTAGAAASVCSPPLSQEWQAEANKAMRNIRNDLRDVFERSLADGDFEAAGKRWAAALQARYPDRHQAKRIARDFDVDIRTAQGWLSGQYPHFRNLIQAAALFGPAMVVGVIAPDSALAVRARALDDLSAIETRLAKLAGDIQALRGETDT